MRNIPVFYILVSILLIFTVQVNADIYSPSESDDYPFLASEKNPGIIDEDDFETAEEAPATEVPVIEESPVIIQDYFPAAAEEAVPADEDAIASYTDEDSEDEDWKDIDWEIASEISGEESEAETWEYQYGITNDDYFLTVEENYLLTIDEYTLRKRDKNIFAVSALGGFMWGRGKEIVYHGIPPLNDNPYYSLLLWDFKPLIFFGVSLDYAPPYPWLKNGFYGSLSLKVGLPLRTGVIEDFDWMGVNLDYITHYSQHDAFSRSTFSDLFTGFGTFTANLDLGYSWSFYDNCWLRPYGEFSFYRFSWTSIDGYTQYGPNNTVESPDHKPWDPNSTQFPKNTSSGPAIYYSQNWMIFAPGISAGVNFMEYFNFSLFISITPLIYGAHRDDHLSASKEYVYLDYLFGGFYMRNGMTFEFVPYIPLKNLSIMLSAVMLSLNGSRGDNYISKFGGTYEVYPGTAGGGFNFGEFTVAVKYTF